MRTACWITKATNTHSEYVIFIAFPRQKWLRESASMLRYSTSPVFLIFMDINDFSAMNVLVICGVIPRTLVGIY